MPTEISPTYANNTEHKYSEFFRLPAPSRLLFIRERSFAIYHFYIA